MFKYLAERTHHEIALVHERMGYLQVGFVDVYVVVEQYVDVDYPVMILPADGLQRAPHLTFDSLRGFKDSARRERCLHTYGGVDKHV